MNKESIALPTRDGSDVFHSLVKAGISSIPLVGGAAVELFTAIIAPPLEKRRDQWMKDVGEALLLLEQSSKVDLETLQNNDAFIDTILRVSHSALRTSQTEKLKIFRNVVLNKALDGNTDLNTQNILIELVDSLTPIHLQALFHFRREIGKNWISEGIGSFPEHFTELRQNPVIAKLIWTDLINRGLITEWKDEGGLAANATELGLMLLDLVSTPSAIQETIPTLNPDAPKSGAPVS